MSAPHKPQAQQPPQAQSQPPQQTPGPHVPGDTVDLTMMYAFHDGLRRDAATVARAAAVTGDDPARLTATHFGWDLFKRLLVVHHTAEDDVLWPKMRAVLANRPDDIELLDAMEAEHARIDPLIAAVDAAIADQENGHAGLADAADAFAAELNAHLVHEEKDALPLIEHDLPPADWAAFADGQRQQIGIGLAPRYLPWLLDGATPERIDEVLGIFPPPLVAQYRASWREEYVRLNPWAQGHGTA